MARRGTFSARVRLRAHRVAGLAAATTLLLVVARSGATACPYSIRDAAFLAAEQPSRFALYIAVDGDRADAETRTRLARIETWLDAARATWLDPAGVDTRIVARGPDGGADWRALDPAVLAAVGDGPLPAAILVSPDGTAIVVGRAPEFRLEAASLAQVAERVVSSPARERLRQRLPEAWCIALLVEGRDTQANAAARAAFEEAARAISGRETELGKTISPGPELIAVPLPGSPAAAPERVLLWSQGLQAPRAEPRLVLLTGRAERRAELLAGQEIRTASLVERFEMLGRSCSCTTSPAWLSGPRVPLRWTRTEEEAVRRSLGFDPEDPEVVRSIREATGTGRVIFEDPGLGYSEISLGPLGDDDPEPAGTRPVATVEALPQADDRPLPSDEAGNAAAITSPAPPPGPRDGRTGRSGPRLVLILLALAVAAIAVATAVVVQRARRAE